MTPPVDGARSQPQESARPVWVFAETAAATAMTYHLALRLETSLVLAPPRSLSDPRRRRSFSQYGLDLRLCPPPLHVHAFLGLALVSLYGAGHAAVSFLLWHKTFVLKLPENPLAIWRERS